MWIIGLIMLLIAVALGLGYVSHKRRLQAMEETTMADVAHLQALAASMAEGVGAGSLFYRTEIQGTIHCDAPLISELSETACVYYAMRVQREYEETSYEQDAQGNRRTRTSRGRETVANNTRSVPFRVADATGQIDVEPGGARFIAEKALSQFLPEEGSGTGRLQCGRFLLDVGTMLSGGRRTLGYHYEEEVIPVGRTIYVLGEATDRHGHLCVSKPHDKGEFLVSVKREEELQHEGHRALVGFGLGAIACGVIGAGLLLAGLLQR